METKVSQARRPVTLWVIVGLYSLLILANFAFLIYMRFWSSYRVSLAAKYADWTLVDYSTRYYPGVLILIGCLGLVMLRRWALYVFALLLVLRLWEVGEAMLGGEFSGEQAIIVWFTRAAALVPAGIALLYTLHLSRKGMLRKGVY